MKNKFRKIHVKGIDFLWTHQFKYVKNEENKYQSISRVTIYQNGHKNGLLLVKFRTWEDAIVGNPLNFGCAVDDNTEMINLNKPKEISRIIEYALQNGWDRQKRMTIDDGFAVFSGKRSSS